MGDLDVDSVIEKLLEVRGSRPGKQVNLSENDVKVRTAHPTLHRRRSMQDPLCHDQVRPSCTRVCSRQNLIFFEMRLLDPDCDPWSDRRYALRLGKSL
jgi:hypothetical protein